MPIVSDYTAILNGPSWWGTSGIVGKPIFLTYSFDTTVQPYLTGNLLHATDSFQPFSSNEMTLAQNALSQWAAISGITFFQVPAGQGDLQFGKLAFSQLGITNGSTGFGEFPVSVTENDLQGDVFVDTNIPAYEETVQFFLHEIGHALGLKHPFDSGTGGNPAILSSNLQNFNETVMSYTSGGYAGNSPGILDIQAIQYLYGNPASDGTQVASWSWDPVNYVLSQTGGPNYDLIRGTYGVDIIHGGGGADSISGDAGDDQLYGDDGNDTIVGGSGDDQVYGGNGDDTLAGQAGNNFLDGGTGNDSALFGGPSNTFAIARQANGDYIVSDSAGTEIDTLRNIERLQFTDQTLLLAIKPSADLSDSMQSAMIWQNSSGQLAAWTVNLANNPVQNGGALIGGNPGSSWHVIGTADFNGDNKADILWQNGDGQAAIWTMDGFTQTGGGSVGANPGTSWHVKAAGDFNGDGFADILWQNDNGQAVVWLMNGSTQIGGGAVGGNPGTSWHVVAAADFNGDGKADILWQNDSGQVAIWTMDGLTQTGGATIGGNPGSSWRVKGAGDFNGDGKADILWQNDNGQAAIWTMDGLNQIGGSTVGGNPGTSWHVIGSGDYNSDGFADILWQNDSGQAAIWTMNGLTQIGGATVGGNPGTAWHLVST